MMYLNDHHSQVLAKLRALISSALQQLFFISQVPGGTGPPLTLTRNPYKPDRIKSNTSDRSFGEIQ